MYKTLHGLVLREVVYKESSKMLTILTEEEGKVTAEARGVLRKGSRSAGAAQVLTYSEMTFSEYRGRLTLTEGSVLEDFSSLRTEIENYSLGCYLAELLEAVSDEDSPSSSLLHLGLNALFALSRHLYPPEHIKACFELRLMCLAGFEPQTERCCVCSREDLPFPRLTLEGGGVHCTDCTPDTPGRSMSLCGASLAALRHICHASPKKIYSFTMEPDSEKRLDAAAEAYVLTQLDRGFRTLDYWKQINNNINYVNKMTTEDNNGTV